MPNPLDTLHRGYQIHTWAVQLPNRRFKAQAVVLRDAGAGDPELVNISPQEFNDGYLAASHALNGAISYVDAKV